MYRSHLGPSKTDKSIMIVVGGAWQSNGALSPRTPGKTGSILKGAKSPRSSSRKGTDIGPSVRCAPSAVPPSAAPATSGSQTERRYDQVWTDHLSSATTVGSECICVVLPRLSGQMTFCLMRTGIRCTILQFSRNVFSMFTSHMHMHWCA